jgi:cellulose synthase/poly-beta-1,6-N-acetylglucosamine synthase-like glycosyltransferase
VRTLIFAAEAALIFSLSILTLYAVRHYLLAISRLWSRRRWDLGELAGYYIPSVTVLVPMHNEEKVAEDILQALVESDYDPKKLEIIAIDDRSTDGTAGIIDAFAAENSVVKALHRTTGNGGKPGALTFATQHAHGDIVLMFDADYIPGRAMLKRLVAPFCDPEVGAVMGRVVPHNVGDSVLAGLLSLERAAGYQVGQEAKHRLGLVPQFGGTVGGVRSSALRAVGGWNIDSLTEDTDLTCRFLLEGWKVAYVNRAECYEEVPHQWPLRRQQLTRWVIGHTQCFHRYCLPILLSRRLSVPEKVDSVMMLACYFTAPLMMVAWLSSLVLFFALGLGGLTAIALAAYFAVYQLFANQATFFEIGTAAVLDGPGSRILLLPANLLNFFASTGAICSAIVRFYARSFLGLGGGTWHKTPRSRQRTNGNGHSNGNGNSNGASSGFQSLNMWLTEAAGNFPSKGGGA